MNFIQGYAGLYRDAALRTFKVLAKNAWTLVLPVGLAVGLNTLTPLVAPLGLVGGFLLGMAEAAVFSCYLYVLGELVTSGKVSVRELPRSFGAYFWSVINLLFVFWVAELVIGMALGAQAAGLLAALKIVTVVALNAAPETIYQKRTYGGLETIQRSFEFLQENWLAWFLPSVPLLLLVGWLFIFAVPGSPWVEALLAGAAFHLAMVFRGFLFAGLTGSSHRQRMFRARTGL